MRADEKEERFWEHEWRYYFFIFTEIIRALGIILLGLGALTVIQFILYPPVVALARFAGFPSLGLQLSDWNTFRVIWAAEVPLAFVIKWALGGYKSEQADSIKDRLDVGFKVIDARIDYADFLIVGVPNKKKKLPSRFYIVDKRSHKLYRGTENEWFIAKVAGLFDFAVKPEAEVMAYLQSLGCDTTAPYENLPFLDKGSFIDRQPL